MRPDKIVEFICTSRLAAAAALYPADSSDRRACDALLAACTSVKSAEAWFSADASRGSCPAELVGQEIGQVEVTYSARHAIPKQRRYADGPCLFRLPRKARYAAAYGLYVDGDLVASELIALQHACHVLGIDCENLDDHLANRELQLAALGKSHCPASLSPSQRRDFAKAYVNAIIHGAGLHASLPGAPPNAVAELFARYGVLPSARPPLWLKNLHLELKDIGPSVVDDPAHANVMNALRADPEKRDKAARWASALHYVLAPYVLSPPCFLARCHRPPLTYMPLLTSHELRSQVRV